jgi:hypothetical protein
MIDNIIFCRLGEDAIKKKQEEEEERMQQEKDQETTWYHEGPEALRVSRLWIASEQMHVCTHACVCAHAYTFFEGTTLKQIVENCFHVMRMEIIPVFFATVPTFAVKCLMKAGPLKQNIKFVDCNLRHLSVKVIN